MEPTEHLDHYAAEADLLATAARAAGGDAPVTACPGWTVDDLVRHVAGGDAWARTVVESGRVEMPQRPTVDGELVGEDLVAYYRAGANALVRTLAEADPDAAVWTFFAGDRSVRFWIRRRAQETLVHRVDAERAAGAPNAADPALASDGIDEYLTMFVPRFGPELADIGGSVHVHCTDVEGEWLVVPAPDAAVVTREHAKGDVAVRGRAEDLLLLLWGRGDVDTEGTQVFGDTELLERFLAAIRL
jgi:uncharacterized protein (TIGR03083 family)